MTAVSYLQPCSSFHGYTCLLLYLCFYDIFLVLSVCNLLNVKLQPGGQQPTFYYSYKKRQTFMAFFLGINFEELETAYV